MLDRSVPFSLGFFSDVQYANQPNRGACCYRDSLCFLEQAIDCFNERDLEAVINLGDLVDSNDSDHLDAVLNVLKASRHPVINVLGNHDLLGPTKRQEVLSRLDIEKTWGQCFRMGKWRVVMLDSTEISTQSVKPSSLEKSTSQIHRLRQLGDPCAENWNGMASSQQLREIEGVLIEAGKCNDRVLILNHMLVGEGSGSSEHFCWNHRELRHLFEVNRSVAAHFNGHDHGGGFITDNQTGIHYLTFPAICDSIGGIGAHAVAKFEENAISLEGWGKIPARKLHCGR